ncbi:hypothetical protein KR074_009612 [Drosophila pseudoananassae]|nr:hypothetical protein KR074_009612 [Drosophila pseudoananassae]
MAFLTTLLLLCTVLVIGVARRSRCTLIFFSVSGLFCIIICWLLACIYLASSVAAGDFCMRPHDYMFRQVGMVGISFFIYRDGDRDRDRDREITCNANLCEDHEYDEYYDHIHGMGGGKHSKMGQRAATFDVADARDYELKRLGNRRSQQQAAPSKRMAMAWCYACEDVTSTDLCSAGSGGNTGAGGGGGGGGGGGHRSHSHRREHHQRDSQQQKQQQQKQLQQQQQRDRR